MAYWKGHSFFVVVVLLFCFWLCWENLLLKKTKGQNGQYIDSCHSEEEWKVLDNEVDASLNTCVVERKDLTVWQFRAQDNTLIH